MDISRGNVSKDDFDNLIKEIKIAKKNSNNVDDPYKSIFEVIFKGMELLLSDDVAPDFETNQRQISINLFLKDKDIQSHTDRVIVMAFYLCKFRKIDPFNVNDISELYSESRIKAPKNLNDSIKKQERKGYLIEKGEKEGLKAWTLSFDGIDCVKSLIR